MAPEKVDEKQPWANCLLADLLISHLEDTVPGPAGLDYAAIFRGIQGFETPPDPRAFLKDVNNWVPLPILRDLSGECERLSGRKDFAYHAARAYFDPAKKHLPSLLETIARVLNDVRSVVICSNLWSTVLANYVRLQSFERPGRPPELFILAQFDENSRPTTTHLLRGVCEGLPRLYPFIEDVQVLEEISQLRLEDILRDFPEYAVHGEGNEVSIRRPAAREPIVRAVKMPLHFETVHLSRDFRETLPDRVVVPPQGGQLSVLTTLEGRESDGGEEAVWAYRVVQGGVVAQEDLAYSFREGQVYGAPYCRFRFLWKERGQRQPEEAAGTVRKQVSDLLFDHLRQIKETQMRMVQHHIEKRGLALENIRLRREIGREFSFAGIVGQSPQMQELFGRVRSITQTEVTVLLQGETGTGKELVARAIHYNGPRREKRFVAINCGALSETLLESELFGHEKGAFTGAVAQRKGIFEAANRGTLFLDEIGEVGASTQVKLLRVLQEGEFQRLGGSEPIRVNVRIVAAANRDLRELVRQGRIREDLYYRLMVFPITVPALRERPQDVPRLVSHFIEKHRGTLHKEVAGIGREALASLMGYGWPGNVRELENVILRMMVECKGETLEVGDLPEDVRAAPKAPPGKPRDLKEMARETTELVERRAILEALEASRGNVTKAARALGISRASLQHKMKEYGLRRPEG